MLNAKPARLRWEPAPRGVCGLSKTKEGLSFKRRSDGGRRRRMGAFGSPQTWCATASIWSARCRPDAGRPRPWWHAIPPACWPNAAAWRRSPIDGCSSDRAGDQQFSRAAIFCAIRTSVDKSKLPERCRGILLGCAGSRGWSFGASGHQTRALTFGRPTPFQPVPAQPMNPV
jgi:hypothetical protein